MIKYISTRNKREGIKPSECEMLIVIINDTEYRISIHLDGLEILKYNVDDCSLNIKPGCANVIVIK